MPTVKLTERSGEDCGAPAGAVWRSRGLLVAWRRDRVHGLQAGTSVLRDCLRLLSLLSHSGFFKGNPEREGICVFQMYGVAPNSFWLLIQYDISFLSHALYRITV